MSEDFIRTGEFDRTMEALDKKIDKGFEGIHERFNKLEPEVLQHAKDIAVLQYQANAAHDATTKARAEVRSAKTHTSSRAAAFGSGAAGLVWVLIEFGRALKTYITGH